MPITGEDLVVLAWVVVENGVEQWSRRPDGSGSAHAGEPCLPCLAPLSARLRIGEDLIDRRRLADQEPAAVVRTQHASENGATDEIAKPVDGALYLHIGHVAFANA